MFLLIGGSGCSHYKDKGCFVVLVEEVVEVVA